MTSCYVFSLSHRDDVSLDPNSFIQAMQKVFGTSILEVIFALALEIVNKSCLSILSEFEDDRSDTSSDMDEYGSEDDMNSLSPGSPVKPMAGTKKGAPEDFLGMKEYMDLMDRELAKTSIGQSFERQESPKKVGFLMLQNICLRNFV